MKPIIFSTEMVQAILRGDKTQTRRVVNPKFVFNENPDLYKIQYAGYLDSDHSGIKTPGFYVQFIDKTDIFYEPIKSPYGQIGDRLWIREPWTDLETTDNSIEYKATSRMELYVEDYDNKRKWKPSIYMPKKYARIFLEITDIRVERIQDITEDDVISEGFQKVTKDQNVYKYCIYDKGDYSSIPWQDMPRDYITAFKSLWNSINKKRGYSWESNPWVWVVEFKISEVKK